MLNGGDVVWIDFPGVVGVKRRPAVVLSSEVYHAVRPDVVLGLVTSRIGKANGPTDYHLRDWSAAGLRVPSAFRAFVVTLPRATVIENLGSLSDHDWRAVQKCVRTALEIEM